MEYEFDKNEVEQLQGRLATDQVEEAQQLNVPNPDNDEDQLMQEEEEERDKQADEVTEAQAK